MQDQRVAVVLVGWKQKARPTAVQGGRRHHFDMLVDARPGEQERCAGWVLQQRRF